MGGQFSQTVRVCFKSFNMHERRETARFQQENLLEYITHQWRIQDFLEGGAPTPEVGALTYCLAKFSRKLHENEGNWTERGASLAPPKIRQCHMKSTTLQTANLLHEMFTTSILQVNLTWATDNDSGRKIGLNYYMEHQEWDVTPVLATKYDYNHMTHVCTLFLLLALIAF